MRTLEQTFRFPGATKDQLAGLFAAAPLVGDNSIFGNRKVASVSSDGPVRRALGFEPAPIPLLRFDVAFHQEAIDDATVVVVEFAQPSKRRPYLGGGFIWRLEDDGDGAILNEEINTPAALAIVSGPLDGASPSFRRWLFFAGGHKRLMHDVADNLEALLDTAPD